MANILSNLPRAVLTGFVLAALLIVLYLIWNGVGGLSMGGPASFWSFLLRWLHVIAGVMWIGLLWYFNFVQMIAMPKIPAEQKPAVSKFVAPQALFWFRWSAAFTVLFGILLALINEYFVEVITLGIVTDGGAFADFHYTLLGIGVWLGLVMAFNVWFVIWPNQKVALGIVDGTAEAKAKAARTAMLFSRTNMVLSVPMLFAMVGATHLI
ncbi:MAG TPA: urate hydroxylase PuuD [Kiloniellales bacterium]|nr:urate hydroxylase PuuD [Kiloniellales bacterium]